MWSDEPLSFETNTPYTAGTGAVWDAGRQSSIGHTTMLLHQIGDFALVDTMNDVSRDIDALMERLRAEGDAATEAEPPTQSVTHGNSGEAAAEPAADLTAADATRPLLSLPRVSLQCSVLRRQLQPADAQGSDAYAAVAVEPVALGASACAAIAAARAVAAQITGAPADAAGDQDPVPF